MNLRAPLLTILLLVGASVSMHAAAAPTVPAGKMRSHSALVATPAPPSVWETQWGGFHYVRRIDAASADSVWAVGSNAVHYDGSRWLAVDRRDDEPGPQAVDVHSSGVGWIADGERIVPVYGGKTGPPMSVSGYRFSDVAVVSDDEAWALARKPDGPTTILRHRDGTWQPAWTAPDDTALVSIWMASADDGWAVGSSAVHYDGERWTEWALPVDTHIERVKGTAPDDVWVVGGVPDYPLVQSRRFILHFDGSGWSVALDEPGSAIRAIAVQGSEGYAVSMTGDIYARHGSGWAKLDAKVPVGQYMPYVTDASFVPGTSYALVVTNQGWVYRLQDDEVSLVHDAASFQSVAMLSESLGWTLGRRAMEFDGTDWRGLPDSSPLHRAVDVSAKPEAGAWAVGDDGLVLRYTSGQWDRLAFPFEADLRRIAVVGPEDVLVIGNVAASEAAVQTAAFSYDARDGWLLVWQGPGAARDVAVGRGQALVATDEGIWHYDGATWSQARDTPAESVGLGPAGELWAGDAGTIQQLKGTTRPWEGANWVAKAWLPARSRVHAFAAGGAAVWAVADAGFVLAYDGDGWDLLRGNPDYNGVAGASYGLHDVATVPMSDGATGI